MKTLPVSEQALTRALETLQGGGVIAHATETCYGLAADLSNPEAVQKLFQIKQRPSDQPVSALFSSVDEAKKYVEWNDRAEELAKKYLPGPLTLILLMRKDAPFSITPTATQPKTNNQKPITIGIRISSNPLAHQLAQQFSKPLSTTSANLHGQPNPYSAEEIMKQLKGQEHQPDLILDSGTLPKTPPSTVIDLTGEPEKQIRRSGGLTI